MWKDAFIAMYATPEGLLKPLATGAIHVDTKGAKSVYIPSTKARLPLPPDQSIQSVLSAHLSIPRSCIKIHH